MTRVLIFDDMQKRHDGFRHYLAPAERVHVYTVDEAILALRFLGPFDAAFLDHDIELEELNGHDLAIWLQRNPLLCPPKVMIHSWNPAGAKHMQAVLLTMDPAPQVVLTPYRAPC